jgi:NADH dehydrogenase
VRIGPDETVGVPYDHLVLALGGVSNTRLIPGAEHALGFKTLIDAVILRNHVIDRLERAAAEPHPDHRRALLTFAVVGGGLLGVELLGELTGFVRDLSAWYPHVQPDVRYELIESDPKVLSELDPRLADYAVRVLTGRGVRIRTGSRVRQIEPGRLHLPGGETLRAGTIVAATGVLPNPLLATFPLEKDRKGRVVVDPTLRTSRPEVWALGDCAAIPAPDGGTYPARAQHASRQAKVLADNLHGTLTGRPPRPFRFHTLGTLATLGRRQGVGQVMGWRLRGFPAWLLWRAYYLTRMPQWERRLRILIDWTLASLFRADTVKVDLEDEKQVLQRFGQWFELGPSSRPDAEGATHEEGVLTGPARGT